MWIYEQATGRLTRSGELIATGYSGLGEGKNNPAMEMVHGVGPLPCGAYQIGKPEDTIEHGPHVLPLKPSPETDTFGRGGFLIHGDSVDPDRRGSASHGCIIVPRTVRELISSASNFPASDQLLIVIKGC